ncbi:MAG: exodeoxyribonuclease VII small subunit [Thermodesulfovibrionales bacterium]
MRSSKELTYTKAITELETIVGDIESGEVDVDVLAEKVKRSAELIRFCSDRLKGTQDTVSRILVDIKDRDDDTVENGGD